MRPRITLSWHELARLAACVMIAAGAVVLIAAWTGWARLLGAGAVIGVIGLVLTGVVVLGALARAGRSNNDDYSNPNS